MVNQSKWPQIEMQPTPLGPSRKIKALSCSVYCHPRQYEEVMHHGRSRLKNKFQAKKGHVALSGHDTCRWLCFLRLTRHKRQKVAVHFLGAEIWMWGKTVTLLSLYGDKNEAVKGNMTWGAIWSLVPKKIESAFMLIGWRPVYAFLLARITCRLENKRVCREKSVARSRLAKS